MKYASDFKAIALNALRGNWGTAILTGFVASLIGATGGGSSFNNSSSGNSTNDFQNPEFLQALFPILIFILGILILWMIVAVIIGGAGTLGYAKFNLNLVDRKPASLSDLFSQFNRLGTGFCMNLLISVYVILWSMLFLIPGIIKAYGYSMTHYILSEHPEMTVNEAITESRYIMRGNKWRLFCLHFSFIGWELLCAVPALITIPLIFIGDIGIIIWAILVIVTVFIGNLFLIPYREASTAAFYREISYTNEEPSAPLSQDSDTSSTYDY